jgi:mitogen-activated protein kinase kinase 1
MAKKRPSGLVINCSEEAINARVSYTVTAGTFVKDDMVIGPGGIGGSPGDHVSRYAIEEFEMLEVLGKGASCVCRKGVHISTGTPMAIKIINMADPVKRNQLVTELRALINPPGVAPVPQFVNMIDAFFHEGFVYIALEYMDLGSIDNIQKKCSARVPEAPLSYILREVMLGLDCLHNVRKKLHRDIKPGNILFNSQGSVKLGDFGISKTLQDTLPGLYKEASTYIGTSLYMSPERLQGKKYNFNSDVWSVGIMAIELATGVYPYDTTVFHVGLSAIFDFRLFQGGLYALMSRVIENPPPVPEPGPEFSPAFCQFLAVSLQLDPANRPMAQHLLEHPYLQTPAAHDREGFVRWLHSI